MGKRRTHDELLLIHAGDRVAETLPVDGLEADAVHAGGYTFPRAELACYPKRGGGLLFVAQADLPALVEAQNVKMLVDNALLRTLFGSKDGQVIPWQFWALVGGLLLAVILKR